MSIINYMEKKVDEVIEEILGKNLDLKEKISEDQLIDVKIFALNNLPPCYSTSQKGYAFSKTKCMDMQSKTNITKYVIQGIDEIIKF